MADDAKLNNKGLIACGDIDYSPDQRGVWTTCAKCGGKIVYDPLGVATVKRNYPNVVEIETRCIGCAGVEMSQMDDAALDRGREIVREILGDLADLVSNDMLRRYFRNGTFQ